MYALMVGTHIAFALSAVILGIFVLSMTKGTPRHKLMGRIWVGMMTLVAVGSFSLRDLNHGEFSAIHALSAFTLLSMGLCDYHDSPRKSSSTLLSHDWLLYRSCRCRSVYA